MRPALFLLLSLACLAARPASTDLSDLWWNPAEGGWGANIIQQADILFITLFVYGTGRAPTWYVGPSVRYSGTTSDGSLRYTGPLFETAGGTWFGTPWNPSALSEAQVGTLTATFPTSGTGTLTYSVQGMAVTKQISRQTWRFNNVGGTYLGSLRKTYSASCVPGTVPDVHDEENAVFSVSHVGSSVSMVIAGDSSSCHFSGQYAQAGRLGSVGGSYTCLGGVTGTFQASEVEASPLGMTARLATTNNHCDWSGRIGGATATECRVWPTLLPGGGRCHVPGPANLRIVPVMGTGASAALAFNVVRRNGLSRGAVTLSKGLAGQGTPGRIEYAISQQPGDFVGTGGRCAGSLETFSGTVNVATPPATAFQCAMDPAKTYYLNLRLPSCPQATCAVMVDFIW